MTTSDPPKRSILICLLLFVVLLASGGICSAARIEPAAGLLLVGAMAALAVGCVLALSD